MCGVHIFLLPMKQNYLLVDREALLKQTDYTPDKEDWREYLHAEDGAFRVSDKVHLQSN